METKTWENLLSRRLAFPTNSRNLHFLFCPDGMGSYNDSKTTERDNRKSLSALQMIDNSLRASLRSSIRSNLSEGLLGQVDQLQMKYDDEIDLSNRQLSEHFQEINEGGDSAHGDNDDDLEVMSRAFSVNSTS